MSFTAESVLALYQQIGYGKTRQIKNEANLQIVAFIESTQAWVVAFQLLTGSQSTQDQFIGAQIIYKKIETHFDQIETKDTQILEVRNTLFQILPQTFQKKLVMDRLCMSISLLALKTSNTCWATSIKDFIAMGSESAEKCFVCLSLLKHITALFESQCHERRQKQIAEAYIRENLSEVLGYLAKVLDQTGLPQECYFEALSASKAWCQFSTSTFVSNLQFIQTLFRLMQTEMFPKCVKVIRRLLTVSKFAKSLQHSARDDAINMVGMSPDDKQFIEQVIMCLQQLSQKFVSHSGVKQFSEDEDESDHFPRKYVNLVTCLCANYEFLMLKPELGPGLFGLLKECAKAGNLRLSISSLDFWTDFKETMYICKLTNQESLLNEFKEISQIMLQQSILIPSIPYSQLSAEEVEELEVQEKGIALARFREYTSDILLTTYLLLQREYSDQGEQVIYDLLTQTLQQSQNQPLGLEVCYFAARQIYDGFNDEEWNKATLQFLRSFFQLIEFGNDDFCLIRAQLLFIQEASLALVEMKPMMGQILKFTLKQVYNDRLRTLALEALHQVCEYCKTQLDQADIGELFQFMQSGYSHLNSEHASKLVKSAGLIASILEDDQLFKAIEEICKMPLQDLNNPQSDRLVIIKALTSLRGLILSINDLPSITLKTSLKALFSQTWTQCQSLFTSRANDAELVEVNCDFIVEVISCLPTEISEIFLTLQDTLLRCFIQNPIQNCKCLKAYAVICGTMSKKNDQVKMVVLSTVEQVCGMLLPILLKPSNLEQSFVERVDPEVVACFATYLTKILDLNGEAIVKCSHFPSLMQFFTQATVYVIQPELTNQVISFFLKLIEQGNTKLEPQSKLVLMSHYSEQSIIAALLSVVPNDQQSTVVINRVSQSFIHIMNQTLAMGKPLQCMRQIIINSFDTTQQMKGVPLNIRAIVADFIIMFYNQLMKIRLCLQTICWYVHGQTGEDGFLGLELQVQQRLKEKQPSPGGVIEL